MPEPMTDERLERTLLAVLSKLDRIIELLEPGDNAISDDPRLSSVIFWGPLRPKSP